MSNIYIQEPPVNGKVLLVTSVGDIDIELWSKEAPKACRNFVQLCLEGYYDGIIFHRVVRGFIVQGGDPTGTGEGGESIYGKTFKDEFHSRLRFVRRGLVAMANAGPHDNGSQFFFTMGAAPELNNKHTIFGMVAGNTVYNMLKLEEVEVDENEKPMFPHRILRTKVILNPFDDIVPRKLPKVREERSEDSKKKKSKSRATKNFSLLSFGEEAEEDEEEVIKATETLRGKAKSTHDVPKGSKHSKSHINDEKADMKIADIMKESKATEESEDDSDDGIPEEMMGQTLQELRATAEIIRKKLLKEQGEDLSSDAESGSHPDIKDSPRISESPKTVESKSPKVTVDDKSFELKVEVDSDDSIDLSPKPKVIDKVEESIDKKPRKEESTPKMGSKKNSPTGSLRKSVSPSPNIASKEALPPWEKGKKSDSQTKEHKDSQNKKDSKVVFPKQKEEKTESSSKKEKPADSPRRKDSPNRQNKKEVTSDTDRKESRKESPTRTKDYKSESGSHRSRRTLSPKHKDQRHDSPKRKSGREESPRRRDSRRESPRRTSSQMKKEQVRELSPKRKSHREDSPKRQKEHTRTKEPDYYKREVSSRGDTDKPHYEREGGRSKEKTHVSPHRKDLHSTKDSKVSDKKYDQTRLKDKIDEKEQRRSGISKHSRSPHRSRSNSPQNLPSRKRSHSPKLSRSPAQRLSLSPNEVRTVKRKPREEVLESPPPKVEKDKKVKRLDDEKYDKDLKETPQSSEPAKKRSKEDKLDKPSVHKEKRGKGGESPTVHSGEIRKSKKVELDLHESERRSVKKELINDSENFVKRQSTKNAEEIEIERRTIKREPLKTGEEPERKRLKKDGSEDGERQKHDKGEHGSENGDAEKQKKKEGGSVNGETEKKIKKEGAPSEDGDSVTDERKSRVAALRREVRQLQREIAMSKKKLENKTKIEDTKIPGEEATVEKETKDEKTSHIDKPLKSEKISEIEKPLKSEKPGKGDKPLKVEKTAKPIKPVEVKKEEKLDEDPISSFKADRPKSAKDKPKLVKGKGSDREAATLAMLAKFTSKLQSIKQLDEEKDEEVEETDLGGYDWMKHKLTFDAGDHKVLDANVTDAERYEIYDPRNPMNQRRRESSKNAMKEKTLRR